MRVIEREVEGAGTRARWARLAAGVLIGVLAVAAGGCGKSGLTKEQKQFRSQATTRCSDALTPVSQAADFTAPGAPYDSKLVRAAGRLRLAASQVGGLRVPDKDRRRMGELVALQRRAATVLDRYVQGDHRDTLGNDALSSVSTVLTSLEDVADRAKIPACALNVEE